MIKLFSKWILKLLGWKIEVNMPSGVRKAVMLVAPHTTNYDFFIGRLVFNVVGLPVKFLIKKEAFFFPFGGLLKKMGGIPVKRGERNNLVHQLAAHFEQADKLVLVVTPEGTRKYTKYWKKGFYYIALEAQVPIALGYLDYKHKKAGVKKVINPSGDLKTDFEDFKAFYQTLHAYHPEKFCTDPKIRN